MDVARSLTMTVIGWQTGRMVTLMLVANAGDVPYFNQHKLKTAEARNEFVFKVRLAPSSAQVSLPQ